MESGTGSLLSRDPAVGQGDEVTVFVKSTDVMFRK